MPGDVTDVPNKLFQVSLPPRPYPGLRPYESDEWPIFFGRERMADAVAERLVGERLLVVHGDSGCGKSSLIRAGVLPRLEQESARGGVRWRTCSSVPGEAPLWNIAEAVAGLARQVDESEALSVRRVLNFGRDSAVALAELLREKYPGEYVCLLIDQFEELFDHVRRHGPDEAKLLTEFLVGLHEERPEGLCTIVTMRSEFLGVCSRYGSFADVVNKTQYLLPGMGPADLMRAIREPATLFNGEVSRELAERLMADAGGGQDQLPLIQHGLMCLYDDRKAPDGDAPWRLGTDDYRHPRGLAGLLSDHADAVMQAAQQAWPAPKDEGEDRLVEDMFRALTDINADGQAIRRRQTLAQIAAATGAEVGRVAGVADMFRAEGVSFIKPYGCAPLEPGDLLDVSHEALIRCWEKIAERKDGWLVREFRNGLVWRALQVQADSFDRDPANILSAATAEERQVWLRRRNADWAERYGGGWDRVRRLVDASVKEAENEREEERKALVNATRRRWLIGAAALATILTLVSATFAFYALKQAERAEQERMVAEAARNEADRARQIAEAARTQEQAAQLAATVADERASKIQDVVAQSVQRETKGGLSIDDLIERLEGTKDPYAFAVLAQGIVQGSETLTARQATRIYSALLKTFQSATEASARTAVAQAIVPLAPKLTPDQAAQAFEEVLAAAKAEPDRPTRQALQAAGLALAERLPDEERPRSIREIQRVAGETVGERFAATVPSLDAKAEPVRKRTTQELATAVRDPKIAPDEQRKIVAALVNTLGADQLQGWTATGRHNAMFVLTQVPPASWRQPGWPELARALRSNLAALARRMVKNEVEVWPDTRALMSSLEKQLG